MLACEKQSSLEFARIATFMVERLIPPNDVQVVLSRHAAFLAGRPGGVRLQQPGGQYARLRLDGAMLDELGMAWKDADGIRHLPDGRDRKSTRLNSSH